MRRKDREITEIGEILKIVEKAKILHMGLFDGEYPYVVPLHYGFEYADGNLVFYMHSAKEGHKMDLIRTDPKVCIELECDIKLVSGGDIPCKYGASFSCVIGRGVAEFVCNEQEKNKALKLLMKNQTGHDFKIEEQMAAAVEIIKVVVPSFTAKARRIQE